MASASSLNSHPDCLQQDIDQFILLADQVARFGASIGVKIVPYRNINLPHFSPLPFEQRQRALVDLKNYVEICNETISEGKSLRDTPQLIWFALKKLGYRPTSDLFEHITDDVTVEIHDRNFFQVFRNFVFYDCCSYSLEELYSFPWNILFHRDEKTMPEVIGFAQRVLSGEFRHFMPFRGPKQVIQETQSAFKYEISCVMYGAAPLYEVGTANISPVATICVEKAELSGDSELVDEESLLSLHQ